MPRFEVGAAVEARFANNALGNYVRGTVTEVTIGPQPYNIGGGGHGWYADKGILVWLLCCRCLCEKRPVLYNIKYDDGRLEDNVPEALVRRVDELE